jgi:phosphoglycolate phosphatase
VSPPTFVVFDLDGTLADSQEGILFSFHATLADLGRSATDDELRDLIGPPLGDSFARLGFAGEEIADVVALYRRHYDKEGVDRCRPYDGVLEMLDILSEAGVRLGLATAKRVDFAVRVLENFGVLGAFETVCGASMDSLFTTKVEILGEALTSLGNPSPADGWMVGDRREDVIAALHHGLRAVGVTWGYGSQLELVDGGVSTLFATPSELSSALLVG